MGTEVAMRTFRAHGSSVASLGSGGSRQVPLWKRLVFRPSTVNSSSHAAMCFSQRDSHQFVACSVGNDRDDKLTAASAVVTLMSRLVTGAAPHANPSRAGRRRRSRLRALEPRWLGYG